MEYIEDLVKLFSNKIFLGNFDQRIAQSLAEQVIIGNPFTEKQGLIAVRLIKKYRKQFVMHGVTTVDALIEFPKYKMPFRIVDRRKTAEIYKDIEHNKKLVCLKFPYSQETVDKIKQNHASISTAKWDGDKKVWLLSLDEQAIKTIITYLIPNGFEVDDELAEYIAQYTSVESNIENFIPMLDKDADGFITKNIREKARFPTLESALQGAKIYGIQVFSDVVADELKNSDIAPRLKKMYENVETQNYFFDKKWNEKSDIIEVAKTWNLTTAIFLDDTLKSYALENWVLTLEQCGVKLDDVAVLFRQKNEDVGQAFNDVIKKYGLNKPVESNPKWIFLGGKYPKSLIKNGIRPEVCICENKYVTTHYSVKSVLRNSMINIFYGDHTPKEDGIVVM